MEPTPLVHIYPPSMNTILKRDNAFTLFRSLNTAVLNNYVQLKNSFRDGAHPSHEILNEFKVKNRMQLRNGKNPCKRP